MDHQREKAPTFFTRLAYSLIRKQRPAVVTLSESLGPPGPQTSLSMSSRVHSFNQWRVNLSHPISQFSSSQTSSSIPFSPTSHQISCSLVPTPGSVFNIIRLSTITVSGGCDFYGG